MLDTAAIVEEYNQAIDEFEQKLEEIDKKYGVYVRLEVDDLETTTYSDILPVYRHNIALKEIVVRGNW